MYKIFCNTCGAECADQKVGTRRFQRLLPTKDSKSQIGLEAILLIDDKPAPDIHVCDTCLLDLLWRLAEQSPGTNLAKRVKAIMEGEGRFKAANAELAKREAAVQTRENEAGALENRNAQTLTQLDSRALSLDDRAKELTKRENKVLEQELQHKQFIAAMDERLQEIRDRDGASTAREEASKRLVIESKKKYELADQCERENNILVKQAKTRMVMIEKREVELNKLETEAAKRLQDVIERENSCRPMYDYVNKRVAELTEIEAQIKAREKRLQLRKAS